MTHRELARRYDCARSLIARHLTRARRLQEPHGTLEREEEIEPQGLSTLEILEARIRDPKTSARDLASLVNAMARLKSEENTPPVTYESPNRREGKFSLAEIKNARPNELPRFMPGVAEWFAALPPENDLWRHLPGAPVELIDQYGDAHEVLGEDESFFREEAGWTTPPEWWDPDQADPEYVEELRAKVKAYDARQAQFELDRKAERAMA